VGVEVEKPFVKVRHQEHALGTLFAEELLQATAPADVALVNAGAVRSSLPAGQMKYGDLFDAYPFDGRVVRIPVTAAELSSVIAAHLSNDDHGLFHLAGVRARAVCERGELAVALSRPDGSSVDPKQELVLVTNDFVATGGDELLSPIPRVIKRGRVDTDETLRDVVAKQLAKRTRPLNPDDPEFFDPALPRIAYPGKRPVSCEKR
jgi:2',3'-cyclic-nucleotide 2'-phosphodiesterase (5'-nucleotidase family)